MEPVGAIASVIAISQALGFGINKLRSLANASKEFREMLDELSALLTLVQHLHATVDEMADPQLMATADFISWLQLIEFELGQIVSDLQEVERKMKIGRQEKQQMKGNEPTVAALRWQRVRRRVSFIRDHARRCKEGLSMCLGLLGISQQYENHWVAMPFRVAV